MTEQQRASVATLSKTMAWLSTLGFFLLPACIAYTFLEPDQSQWLMFNYGHKGAELTASIPIHFRALATYERYLGALSP